MPVIKNLLNSIGSYTRNILSPQNALNEAVEKVSQDLKNSKGKRISHALKRQRPYYAKMQIDELEKAIKMAEDPYHPQRWVLYSIYKEVVRDAHLRSQMRTNILKVVGSPYAVYKTGTDDIDEEATRILQTAWFEKFRKIYHETMYWGHSLVEFPALEPNEKEYGPEMVFKDVTLIWREHVKPETGEILVYPQNTTGIPYRDKMNQLWLLEMGDPFDIGLLHIAARDAIWKRYSRSDWSRHSERFGMPMIAAKTGSKNEEELNKMEEMLANFGNNLYVLLDDQDEVEIKESNMSNAWEIYKQKALFCNQEMSKLISGQTGTSDEKAYVGSAEVHEDILNEYVEAAMRSEMYYMAETLFPFLVKKGYPLEGLEFRYLAFNKEEDKNQENPGQQPPKEEDDDDGNPPPPDPDKNDPKKTAPAKGQKKKAVPAQSALTLELSNTYSCECGHFDEPVNLTDLDAIVLAALQKLHSNKISRGDIDADWAKANAMEIWRGVRNGYPRTLSQIEYASPDYNLLRQLWNNVHVFSAFKNHNTMLDLHDQLTDENGSLRSFSQFRKAAANIVQQYNINWLTAEYNQAVGSARMAGNWVRFKENEDILPYLQYRTQKDGRVRESHAAIDGTTLRMDDSWWNRYYPPNGWGCRCDVIQTAGPEKKATGSIPDMPEMFRTNVGKNGQIFNDKHAYFQVSREYENKARNNFGLAVPEVPQGVGLKYKAAKTIKEAEDFAVQAGLAAKATYKDLPLDLANATNKTLHQLKEQTGYMYDEIKAISIRGKYANYVPMQNASRMNRQTGQATEQRLEINRSYFKKFATTKAINDNLKATAEKGHWIPQSYEGLVAHEFGHRLTIEQTYNLNLSVKRWLKRDDISRYGATDLDETLAELFAFYQLNGKDKMKKEWIELFNKYSLFKL